MTAGAVKSRVNVPDMPTTPPSTRPDEVSARVGQDVAWRLLVSAAPRADIVLIVLDNDGTLAPITDDAQHTRYAPEAMAALRAWEAVPNARTLQISGRPVSYLRDMNDRHGLSDLQIPLLGTYGRVARLYDADGTARDWRHPLVDSADAHLAKFLPIFQAAVARHVANPEFTEDTRRHAEANPPVVFETKPGMMTFHFGFGGGRKGAFTRAWRDPMVREARSGLGLHRGPASGAIEVDGLPRGTTDKGWALTEFLAERIRVMDPHGTGKLKVCILGAGDDRGDRAARAVIRRLAEAGRFEADHGAVSAEVIAGVWNTVFSPPQESAGGTRRQGTPRDLWEFDPQRVLPANYAETVYLSPGELGTSLVNAASAVAKAGRPSLELNRRVASAALPAGRRHSQPANSRTTAGTRTVSG